MGDPIPAATAPKKETILEWDLAGELTGGTIFEKGNVRFPAHQESLYNRYGVNGVSFPNGEFKLKWTPNKEVTATLFVLAGPKALATQSEGIKNDKVPIDIPQLDFQWCPSIFCIGIGRLMDPNISSMFSKAILPPPLFGISPFTFTEARLGLKLNYATLWFGVSQGPDRIVDNNSFPFFRGTVEWEVEREAEKDKFSGAVNWFCGPEQDNNKDLWQHRFDAGITYESSSVKASLYGQFGFEQTILQGLQKWGGGDFNFFVRPPNSKIGGIIRFGYTYDEGFRSKLPEGLSILQVTGGLSLYPFKFMEIRAQADFLFALNGKNNLAVATDDKLNPILELAGVRFGRSYIPRVEVQAVFYYGGKVERIVKEEPKK